MVNLAPLEWLQTLADATRVRLLLMLEQQELSVSELCGIVQLPQSTVSRHLKVLSADGWIVNRHEGTNQLYLY
ncbi:MAG: metalloregulator ArsR/SmtB family transcription factor [Pirellulaceae bacterium]